MKHYDIVEWTDFARGVTESSLAEEMRRHLQAGCDKCAGTARRLEKLVSVIAAESSLEVPESVVHNAMSIFSLAQPARVPLRTLLAQLIFDSFRQPLPAGVRSRQRLCRHAMYEAGDFCVDLRLEDEGAGSRVNLVGQVAHSKVPETAIANVPVSLLRGEQVVAKALSNEYGEFHLEYEPSLELRLQVPVERDVAIEVRLNELSAEESAQQDLLDEDQRRGYDKDKGQ